MIAIDSVRGIAYAASGMGQFDIHDGLMAVPRSGGLVLQTFRDRYDASVV